MHQKIFLSCFLGALIGALIGINLGFGWFWAGIAGFIVGYVTYDFGHVRQITKIVASEVYQDVVEWRADRRWWKAILSFTIAVHRVTFSLISLPTFSIMYIKGRTPLLALLFATAFIQVIAATVFTLSFLDSDTKRMEQGIAYMPAQNPVKFWLWTLPKWVLTQLYRVLIFVWSIALRTPRFVLGVLRLIHSDIRLLCGTDAAIGAIIGFLFGYAIVGAIIGGVLGVLNYELVSKRLLKVSV
jgi:uncharacterized membrane protein